MKPRVLLAMLAVVIIAGHQRPAVTAAEPSDAELFDRLDLLERQARILTESAAEVEARYWQDVAPIERALLADKRVRDPAMARMAAWSIIRAIRTRPLSPRLMASIIGEENPWLITDTTSSVGATGWMQVMPFHAVGGRHREACGSSDLTDGDINVCYGADIFHLYLGQELDKALSRALLRYSGCVSTPGCERYADHVLRRLQ